MSHNRIGDVLLAQGDGDGASAAYQAGLAIREPLARRDPGNTEWQRDLSVSHNKLAMCCWRRATAGRPCCQPSRPGDREALARRDPGNTEWQRDLSVSHDKIGDVLLAQGDRDGALAAYQAGLAIADALAAPTRATQGGSATSRSATTRSATCCCAQGDRDGALSAYQASLAIREPLSRRDPGNTQWQRDLSVSRDKIRRCTPG